MYGSDNATANGIRGKKCTAGSLIISSFYDANAALVGGCKSRGKWVLLRARNKFVGLGEQQKKCTNDAAAATESLNCGSCFFARPV
jgi:hypothetical protein